MLVNRENLQRGDVVQLKSGTKWVIYGLWPTYLSHGPEMLLTGWSLDDKERREPVGTEADWRSKGGRFCVFDEDTYERIGFWNDAEGRIMDLDTEFSSSRFDAPDARLTLVMELITEMRS